MKEWVDIKLDELKCFLGILSLFDPILLGVLCLS